MLMILKKYNVTQVIIKCFHVPPAVCLRTPRGTRTPGWESGIAYSQWCQLYHILHWMLVMRTFLVSLPIVARLHMNAMNEYRPVTFY